MLALEPTNVLVVDDLPEKLLVYDTILSELGQNLVQARSGEEALRQVLQRDFAVILLDVNMPTMDGFETAAMIRKRKRSAHTPIIFVTAFADEVRIVEGYALGAVDYILTPVVPDILRAKVKVFVELFQMSRQVMRQAEERVALAEERTKRLAAEEANRNLSFLAMCGAVLGQSLDFEATVTDLSRVSVPYLADSAAVVYAEASGEWKATVARLQGSQPVVEQSLALNELPEQHIEAIVRVFASGLAECLPKPSHRTNQPTVLVLPLNARGRTIAVLTLARDGVVRSYNRLDQDIAETLASRGAVALENAKLFRELQEADRQKNEFLSMLAHELRNPLAPIRNAVELLRLRSVDSPELAWARDVISRQVRHMVRLVDDLLDASRITQGKIRLQAELVDISAVVAQAVEASRPEIDGRKHQLDVCVPDTALRVIGDPARLTQVLTNLLNNAAKYTSEGGQIWLKVTTTESEMIAIHVRDTGIGIPAGMLHGIFDLFTQVDRSLDRSEGGLGIGLTLVRQLVELHHGRVEARSAGPGQGSEFVVFLPDRSSQAWSNPPSTDTPSETWPTVQPKSKSRVLIVDDNRDGAESLAVLLRLQGYDTLQAEDGSSALETAMAFRPEVVLLDIGLPGMDGYEVARRLRNHDLTKDALLVAMTGYGQNNDRHRSKDAGFDYHLIKPVEFNVLSNVLARNPDHKLCSQLP